MIALIAFRSLKVLPKLEEARQKKVIGKALDAVVRIDTVIPGHVLLFEQANGLPNIGEMLGVSAVEIAIRDTPEGKPAEEITVIPAAERGRQKCARCWHWETDVGSHAEHPTICGRCVQAVTTA